MECCYIPVLLWKRVLVSWRYILKTAIATHSNVIPFDSEYEIFDNVPYWSHLIICRISHKLLNLEVEIILSLNRK